MSVRQASIREMLVCMRRSPRAVSRWLAPADIVMDGTLLHLQRNSVHAQIIACIARQNLSGKPWFSAEHPQATKHRKDDLCVADDAIRHV